MHTLVPTLNRLDLLGPNGAPSRSSGSSTPQRIQSQDAGYTRVSARFSEAQLAQQLLEVERELGVNEFIPAPLIAYEARWFYHHLGIDLTYFAHEAVTTIAAHIESLYAAKIIAHSKQQDYLDIKLEKESADAATFIYTSPPGISLVDGPAYERMMDTKYLDLPGIDGAWRLGALLSWGTHSSVL